MSRALDKSDGSNHLILGGGLAGGLIALALANVRRGAGVTVVEQGEELGGNHTWSFHDTDLEPVGHHLVSDLVTHRWPRQQVRFPGRERTMPIGYSSISSAHFGRVMLARLRAAGVRVELGRRVIGVGANHIDLDGGATLRGDLVLDARGPEPAVTGGEGGYQKFVGLEVELQSPGPWSVPLLMDATVPQTDGYRFMYVLPFSARRVLVEDTVYSANPEMDAEKYEREIVAYVERNGATVARVVRREQGVLPLPTRQQTVVPEEAGRGGDRAGDRAVAVGYRGGFFHPVTGYSLPLAVRVALAVASAHSRDEVQATLAEIHRQLRPQRRFGLLLNRLMFEAMPARWRWTAFDRFYRLPQATISRFYACRSNWWDQARVLVGRPPRGISWRQLMGQRGPAVTDGVAVSD